MKRVLLLGPTAQKFEGFLQKQGLKTLFTESPLHKIQSQLSPEDFVVSYGYRHLLKPEQLIFFNRTPINLHISLLPWNRGMYPNAWSFLENTPKGVTIHLMSADLDQGDILLQKEVFLGEKETLKSSYDKLQKEIETLFLENWTKIQNNSLIPQKQGPGGSHHFKKDLDRYSHLLVNGWDTEVSTLIGAAL